MLIDCASSLRPSFAESSPGHSSPPSAPSRTSAPNFTVVPKSGISLGDLMTPRLRPAPPTSAQSSSSLQLEHVLEDEDSYTFVSSDTTPVGGALLHKSVQDVIDDLAKQESSPARRQRQLSVVSWASTTVEAVHEHPRYDSDYASSLTPSPRDRTILPPAVDDASHSPTPASSASRAISVSTSRLERSSPAPVASAWSGRDDSSGDDVDCDIKLDDAAPRSPKVASASKSLWYGARPHRLEAESQSPPRTKAKNQSSHIREAKSKARGRAASRRAPAASSTRSFKCKYVDPVTGLECPDGKCVKPYDLVRHLITIHVKDEIALVRSRDLAHHPDGAPFAEDEVPAPLLSALVPNLIWDRLHSVGLSKQFDFRPEKLLHELALIHRCYDPRCPSRPGEYRTFPRRDTLSKHLRDQHHGRKTHENDAMQPPHAESIDRAKLVLIFGARHADRLMGLSGSDSPDDSEEMDVAPSAGQARSAEPYIKSENVSPQVPLLHLENAPVPRQLSAYPESSPRRHGTRKKRVSFAESPSYATPVLAPDLASTSSSPIIQTPALHATSFLSPHMKPRNIRTPESFSSPLPRSPLRVSTLPPPFEEGVLQSHLSVPSDASPQPPVGLLFSAHGHNSAHVSSPALSTPACLPNAPLPDYSNLSPVSVTVPQTLSPDPGNAAMLHTLGSGLTPSIHGLRLELGQCHDPSYVPSPQYGTNASGAYLAQHISTSDWNGAHWSMDDLQPQQAQPPPMCFAVDPNICLYNDQYASGSADPSPRSVYEHVPSTFSSGLSGGMSEGNESQFLEPGALMAEDSMCIAGIDICEQSPYGWGAQLPSEDIIESGTTW